MRARALRLALLLLVPMSGCARSHVRGDGAVDAGALASDGGPIAVDGGRAGGDAGPRCGPNRCRAGEICCNDACGICSFPDECVATECPGAP